jgi:nucleoside-diphosphate-sugar epimerase
VSHVLLFGASGFLGAHVRALLAGRAGAELTCIGRDRCDLLTASAGEMVGLLRELRPTVVINCAGRLDGTAADLVEANTVVTAKLLDAFAAVDPSIRYVRIGSAGEYGRVSHGYAVAETEPAAPVSAYGVSHQSATRLVELAADADRVDGVTLRVFNPIGAGLGDANVLGRAAAQLRRALVTGSSSITMGPLSAYRDFVDARDVAAAVVLAAFAPTLPHRVFNVGSGQAVSARTAVSLLAHAAGYSGDIREEGGMSARSATVDWMLADIGRAADALGWRPTYELADSVKAIWADAAGADAR